MSIFNYFRRSEPPNSAKLAKERLQIIIAHERCKKTDYLANLQQELLDVISKYVTIDKNKVKVEHQNKGECSVLELNITLPEEIKTMST